MDWEKQAKECLKELTEKERSSLLLSLLKVAAREDPKIFLFGKDGIPGSVWTMDTKDRKNPFKRLPDYPYMRSVVDLFMTEKFLLFEKSRQMRVTWMITALYLWEMLYHPGRHIIFQSKKEEDANETLERAKFIYSRLEDKPKVLWTYCHAKNPSMESRIQAVPQGANVLRQYALSGLFMDEFAFQEQLDETYGAALAAVEGGGRLTIVSTPNFHNLFYKIAKDKLNAAGGEELVA